MFYNLWKISFGLSFNLIVVTTDSIVFPEYSHFMKKVDLSPAKSILNSIAESFEQQGPIYCIVMIYDDFDIGVQSKSLSKFCFSRTVLYKLESCVIHFQVYQLIL